MSARYKQKIKRYEKTEKKQLFIIKIKRTAKTEGLYVKLREAAKEWQFFCWKERNRDEGSI